MIPIGFTQAQCSAEQAIRMERERQEEKWGEQNHDPFTYLAILGEEVGELSEAALHSRFGGPEADNMIKESIHVAAVAQAIVECLYRGTWQWPAPQPDAGKVTP